MSNAYMHALLLSSGPPLSLKALYCLHANGVVTDVLDLYGTSIVKYSRYKRSYQYLNLRHEQEYVPRVVGIINNYIEKKGTDVVIAGDIQSAGLLHSVKSLIKDAMIFPVSDANTLDLLDNKWSFYELLVNLGIPTPKSILIQGESGYADVDLGRLCYPVVVKPLYGESGHGIRHVSGTAELSAYMRGDVKFRGNAVIIQEYVTGYDVDLSILAQDGKIVAHVIQSREKPGILEFIDNDQVLSLGRDIVGAVNYSGVANFDLRIVDDTGKPVMMECNPRFWYTLQASMWSGLNFVEAGITACRGGAVSGVAPVGDKYYMHGYMLRHVLWNPRVWRNIRWYNWKGLIQAMSDPAPFIAAGIRRFVKE